MDEQTLDPEPVKEKSSPAARPRDASTLIIHRVSRGQVEVLMGRRHRRHKFLPQRYVFPGGGVERMDSKVRSASPIKKEVEKCLLRTASLPRVRGLAAAAIRETFEETGLRLGKDDPGVGQCVPKTWSKFFETGLAPAFNDLDYIARAVTPSWRPIRFNARFFMVNSEKLIGELSGSGELLDLNYRKLTDTANMELPLITRRVLELVEANARIKKSFSTDLKIILFKHNGKFHEMIEE